MGMMSSSAPTSAMAVANWFIKKGWDEPGVSPCDQMKLQKLVYYAHAWHLGNGRGPLFEDDIEAWPHGPVIRDLYLEFKDAGDRPIRKLGTRLKVNISDGKVILEEPQHDGTLDHFLEAVWSTYRKYTGIRLSNSTHADGEPWTLVAKLRDLTEKPTIPNDLIEDIFVKKVAKSNAT